jgi:membrane protease YdiL (CAAX protease family)
MSENSTVEIPEKTPTTWNGIDVVLIVLGILFIIFISLIVIMGILSISSTGDLNNLPFTQKSTISLSIGSALLESFAILAGVYFFGIRRRNYQWDAAGIRPVSQRWIAISVAVGLIAIPVSSLVAVAVQYLLDLPLENPQLPFLLPEDISTAGMIIMVILVGLIVPFAEELFFRGILYQWMRDRFGIWIGVIGSSLLFGIVHGEIAIGTAAFVLGVILAAVYERSHSLWPGVIVHALNNTVKIIFLYVMLI